MSTYFQKVRRSFNEVEYDFREVERKFWEAKRDYSIPLSYIQVFTFFTRTKQIKKILSTLEVSWI